MEKKKEFEVWEAQKTNAHRDPEPPRFIGKYEANSFREACYQAVAVGDLEVKYFDCTNLKYWGVALVPNKEDAEKYEEVEVKIPSPPATTMLLNDDMTGACGPFKFIGGAYILYCRLNDYEGWRDDRWVVGRIVEIDNDTIYVKPNPIDGDDEDVNGMYVISTGSNKRFSNTLKKAGMSLERLKYEIQQENARRYGNRTFKAYMNEYKKSKIEK